MAKIILYTFQGDPQRASANQALTNAAIPYTEEIDRDDCSDFLPQSPRADGADEIKRMLRAIYRLLRSRLT